MYTEEDRISKMICDTCGNNLSPIYSPGGGVNAECKHCNIRILIIRPISDNAEWQNHLEDRLIGAVNGRKARVH